MKYEHLIGRPFELGKTDCFDLVRHFYKDNFDITIRNYARPKDWNSDQIDIIGLAHEREGFSKVYNWDIKNLRPGDVLCMAIGASKANHYAIYVGGNLIIHHKANALSNVEVLRDFWRKSTCFVLRHKDVPDLRVEKPAISIQDLINERNRIHLANQARDE